MPLPAGFNPSEHLQDLLIRTHNRMVREDFSDITLDDDITSPRATLKHACLIEDSDTNDMILMRCFFYYFILGKFSPNSLMYGIPIEEFQAERKFKPQVILFFQEKPQDVEPGFAPLTGRISFRLMDEKSETITEAKAKTLANKIKLKFSGSTPYVWRKGKFLISYTDKPNGYQLQLLVRDKSEAKRIIGDCLEMTGTSVDWEKMNTIENESAASRYPVLPPQQTIYGKMKRLPRARPVGDVVFQYAILHVWGIPEPIILVDRSGLSQNPLAA